MRPTRLPTILALTLVASSALAGLSGKVLDRAGKPLPGVSVRQILSGDGDTTDAQGVWSWGTPPTGTGSSRTNLQGVTLRGRTLRVVLPQPGRIQVEALLADGRRTPLLEFAGIAGTNERVLDFATLRPGAKLRVVSPAGIVVLSAMGPLPSSRAAGSIPSAFRAAAAPDTLLFTKVGFDPKRVPVEVERDTYTVVLDSSLASPESLWTQMVSADKNSVGWSGVPSATGYLLRRCGASGLVCTDSALPAFSGYVQGGLSAGRVLRLRVRAVAGERQSSWSPELIVHRRPLPPLSRGKSQDSLPRRYLPSSVELTVPGWRNLRRVRAYSEPTPFQDTSVVPDSVVSFVVGSTRLPVFDSVWIRVVSEDSLGDTASCRILVREETRPFVVSVSPRDTTVPFDTKSLAVTVRATAKAGIANVRFGGEVASGSAGVYTRTVALALGTNDIPITILDQGGDDTTLVLRVVRQGDRLPPSIVRLGPPLSDTLPFAKSFLFRFAVTDNDSVLLVYINGQRVEPVAGVFSRDVPVQSYGVGVVVIARDRSGNEKADTLGAAVVLKDSDGNILRFGRMPDGRIWTVQNLQTLPDASTEPSDAASICARDTCAKYGRAYSWSAAMALPASTSSSLAQLDDQKPHQGICPSGWHVASLAEWSDLIDSAGFGTSDSAGLHSLRSTASDSRWFTRTSETCATPSTTTTDYSGIDRFGFRLLPSRTFESSTACSSAFETFAGYWTPTQTAAAAASSLTIHQAATRPARGKSTLFSVRCVAD